MWCGCISLQCTTFVNTCDFSVNLIPALLSTKGDLFAEVFGFTSTVGLVFGSFFLVASTLATGGILFNDAKFNEDGFFGPDEAPNGGKSPRKDFGNSSGLLLFRVKVALNSFSALFIVLVISFLSGCGVLTDEDSDLSLCSENSSSFLKVLSNMPNFLYFAQFSSIIFLRR